jgi:hypothetical protein
VSGTVAASTAGSVLLLGSPVLSTGPSTPTLVLDRQDAALSLVSAVSTHRHRWPGHPGRRIVLHRVRRGETATGLAVRFHAWTDELRALNHLGRRSTLYIGRRIRIPVVLSAVRRDIAPRHPHATRHHAKRHRHHANRHRHHARGVTHRRHHPHHPWRHADASRAQVRRVVAHTARRHAMNRHVALAIAWQESGWQQRRISSAGAVGAMQVMPATGRWMSFYVRRRLNIYGLHDNATAGVVLFRVLRSQASRRRSIAAYYQGLGSIQEHGRYRSTRHYVRNVVAIKRSLDRGRGPG